MWTRKHDKHVDSAAESGMHVTPHCYHRLHHLHFNNKVDDSIMKKRDARTGPRNSTADLPSAQSAAPPIKRSFFRKFVPWMSKHDQRATTSAANMETNYSTSGEFRHSCSIFMYNLVLTVLGHSVANLPSNRPATDQRATTSAVNMETYNIFGESRHDDNIFVEPNSSYWCRSLIGGLAFGSTSKASGQEQ
jgi:hypothetical protein